SFRLYRSTDGANWVWFASADANATAFTWTAASPGTTYSFRVTAFNSVGESAPSNTATVTTPILTPAAPGNLAATASTNGTQVSLTWTDNSTNEDGFKVYASTAGASYSVVGTASANV